jgi:hypothetical protein
MLDFDLAELYGVETRALKQAVRRNLDRLVDFTFVLSPAEVKSLVSQTVIPIDFANALTSTVGDSTFIEFVIARGRFRSRPPLFPLENSAVIG